MKAIKGFEFVKQTEMFIILTIYLKLIKFMKLQFVKSVNLNH